MNMNRALWLWLPQWPLQRLAVARPELEGQTVVLYEAPARGGLQVVAGGEALGVYPGMPLAEATALAQSAEGSGVGGQGPGKGRGAAGRGTRGILARSVSEEGETTTRSVSEESNPSTKKPHSTSLMLRASVQDPQSLTPSSSPLAPQDSRLTTQDSFLTPHASRLAPLHLEPYDPVADRQALVELAEWCEQFSPAVAIEECERPDGLALDVSGLGPLFGGEEALAARIVHEAAERGLAVRVAIADTLGAAWGIVRESGIGSRESGGQQAVTIVPPGETLAALAPLSVEALRLPAETVELLAAVGISSVRQLLAIPRSSLPVRFGPELLERLDRATGLTPELILPHRAEPGFFAEWSFETPTDYFPGIEQVLEELVRRVTTQLALRDEGAMGLVCRMRLAGGERVRLPVGLYQATASARHLWDLLRLQLETLELDQPVTDLRVEVTATAPLVHRQQELFVSDRRRQANWEMTALVERLSSRLGREAVCRPSLLPDAQPEFASIDLPWTAAARSRPRNTRRGLVAVGNRESGVGNRGEDAGRGTSQKRPGKRRSSKTLAADWPNHREPATRPIWLDPPAEVSMLSAGAPAQFHWDGGHYRIARSWGPERIETGWWRSRCVRRDYYRVETTSGERFWLFRQLRSGRWFLQGEFG